MFFGLDAEEYDREYPSKELLSKIFQYFKPYKKYMIKVIIFLILTSIAVSLVPIVISAIINTSDLTENVRTLILLSLITFLLNFLSYIFNWFQKNNSAYAISNVILDLQNKATSSIMEQSMAFYDKNTVGKIVSRINSDSRDFGEMMDIFMQSVSSFVIIIVVLIPMFILNTRLTLIILLVIVFIFLIALPLRKIAREKTLLSQRALGSVHSFISESMSGIQIAKTFRQEEKLYSQFKDINNQSYKVNLQRALVLNLLFPILFFIQNVAISLIIYYGGNDVFSGSLSAGDLYLFIQNVYVLFIPVFSVATFWPQFQAGLNASERIFSLIDSPKDLNQIDNKKIVLDAGEISIENLSFSYDGKTQVFDEFNLKIKPGESIAIVGHTGAGKSTLAKLIGRFYEFEQGLIKIDGHNIKEMDLDHYRKQIGFIPQSPFIWADDLKVNVQYGDMMAAEEDIINALTLAGGYDWVEELPEGLHTYLNERGKLLSMGQKQLVAFARVLLKNPRILILDEATASVDPFTETRIQEALEKTMKDRTTIIIAHRLWTVRKVDRILVLKNGKIIEEGNHNNLLKKGGHYSQLYNTYFKHQSFEYLEEIKKT